MINHFLSVGIQSFDRLISLVNNTQIIIIIAECLERCWHPSINIKPFRWLIPTVINRGINLTTMH
jgi:hypothetical protein